MLKDVPNSPLEMLKSKEKDATRLGLFPSLEYKGLYRAVTQLLEVAPLIQYGVQRTFQIIFFFLFKGVY